MDEKTKQWCIKTIHILAQNAVFLFEQGEEEATYRHLFLIEQYKDLLENT